MPFKGRAPALKPTVIVRCPNCGDLLTIEQTTTEAFLKTLDEAFQHVWSHEHTKDEVFHDVPPRSREFADAHWLVCEATFASNNWVGSKLKSTLLKCDRPRGHIGKHSCDGVE